MDFFSRDAGQARRAWLNALAGDAVSYVPPELRPWLGIANELNPVVSMERAGQSANALLAPETSGWGRVQATGDMLSNMAGVVAPVAAGSRGAVPAVQAAEDALMGFSTAAGVPQFMADEYGGLRVFHGSPHDFDKFSMDKIGTGEGAQAYGHGLYFADAEETAQAYRDGLRFKRPDSVATPRDAVLDDLNYHRGNVDGVRGAYESMIASGNPDAVKMGSEKLALLDSVVSENPGRMYEVQIDANPEDFLDWDKPLSEQPQVLQRLGMSARPEQEIHDEALRLMTEGNQREPGKLWMDFPDLSKRVDELQNELDRRAPSVTGQEFYRGGANDDVSGILSQMGYGNPEVQSQALRDAGIPGIRYLDAGSRGAGDGSRNYVVFDENLLSIVRKYGWAAAAPLLAPYGLTPEQAQAQYEGQM